MKQYFILGALLAAASTAVNADGYSDYARVVSVSPQTERVNQPREECWTERVQSSGSGGERGIGGALVGGVVGGIVGNQVGGGTGKTVATAGGAIAGAIIGDRIQNSGNSAPAQQDARRCRTVDNWVTRDAGYHVTYEYKGQTFNTVLPYNPGNRLRVRVNVEPEDR